LKAPSGLIRKAMTWTGSAGSCPKVDHSEAFGRVRESAGQHEPPAKAMVGGDTGSPILDPKWPSPKHPHRKAGPLSSFVLGWYPEFPVAGCSATRPECGSVLHTDHPTRQCGR
jgi:hypothetical protein